MADKQQKGRGARGERMGLAKLKDTDVVLMRSLRASGHTINDLAARFNVSEGTVRPALSGKTWSHVK
jgi:hypothetical protein